MVTMQERPADGTKETAHRCMQDTGYRFLLLVVINMHRITAIKMMVVRQVDHFSAFVKHTRSRAPAQVSGKKPL